MKALIIIDMLNDFVDGALANPRAQAILPPLGGCCSTPGAGLGGRVLQRRAPGRATPNSRCGVTHAMAGTSGRRSWRRWSLDRGS